MAFVNVAIFLVALAGPSLQQGTPSWGQGGSGLSGASYTDSLLGNFNSKQGNRCYDRCYEAYKLNPTSYHVSGCVCTNYNYPVVGVHDGRFRGGNCGCPLGTICRLEFGRRTCVSRFDVSGGQSWGQDSSYGSSGSYEFPGNGQHCGYLSPHCRAAPGDYNVVYRYTYDYKRQACVKVLVDASCGFKYGSYNNIFQTLLGCSKQCEYNRSY